MVRKADKIRWMDDLRLFAVTEPGLQTLPLPDGATSFDDMYDGLALGVYSALRTFSHDRFLCLDAHLERTRRSMAFLGWDYQLDEALLRRGLHQACTGYPPADARVRFDVLAEPARHLGTVSRLLIGLMPFTPLPPHVYERGVSVGFAPGLSRKRPLVKTAEFALIRRDYVVSHPKPIQFEYLMLNEAGFILEGGGSNFYGLRDGVVYTAASGVLEGITRRIILDLLPGLGIPLRLEALHRDEIGELDEAALSGSSRALVPVVEIEGQVVADGRPGPVTRRILAAYHAFVATNIKPATAP
jgi:branched-chain amino acid aminotransferase